MDTRTTWNARAILHVDMDAFFASVEQLDHPEWRGLPVVVGGSPEGRGVVSAASYEARAFGIRSATPSARARQLCPTAKWARPRFVRYREISDSVMAILVSQSPRVQQVSIDEAYIDVTPGRFGGVDPVVIAEEIARRVEEIGVTCSIGVATSKTVAKIASDHDKPRGLVVVAPGTEAAFLAPLPVSVLQGIGPKTTSLLESAGIRALGSLAELDERGAHHLLGKHGFDLVRRAKGIDDRPVELTDERKSISNERTFAEDVRDASAVDEAVRRLAAKVASRLRSAGVAGRTVTVKVRFSDFTTRTAQRTVSAPVDLDDEVFALARELVRDLWSPGVGLRLLGVGVSGFEVLSEQLDLLSGQVAERRVDPRQAELIRGLDGVRERFGETAIARGARDLLGRAAESSLEIEALDDE